MGERREKGTSKSKGVLHRKLDRIVFVVVVVLSLSRKALHTRFSLSLFRVPSRSDLARGSTDVNCFPLRNELSTLLPPVSSIDPV